ncbi:MAG: phospho-sugar mutase [Bacteroidetes bacterium]|nr:phospho-sugar mutase [Bacteroidota bacterium]
MNTVIDPDVIKRANTWLDGDFDDETKSAVREMILKNPAELTDSFYRDLEFGTGGLRGIMGTGTNRMNRYTVGMATQGLANYLIRMFPEEKSLKAAISYDSRNNSRIFARITAEVFAANGFRVFLFDDIRPTPELSFTVRHLKCQTGVMLTASHNPKEYNGYKAYWDDGAQMIAPHDVNVMEEVQKITSVDDVRWTGNPQNIIEIGKDVDEAYLDQVLGLSLSPELIRRQKNMKIVYTPLHGCGRMMVPEILKRFGFENVVTVKEQMVADGNFPTVRSPNPEEQDAMTLALSLANEIDADLVMATDPDADRVGIALKNSSGKFILLNGNQTAALLFYYILYSWKEKNLLKGNEYIVSTIVTTELLKKIAEKFSVGYFECLTGFKFIADVIRKQEGKMKYIVGGEESFGYLIGDFVRDKDAVSACALLAEAAAWMADQEKSLFDLMIRISRELGFYKEHLISVTKKGKTGAEDIQKMMVDYRQNPPVQINNSKVILIRDYLLRSEKDLVTGQAKSIDLPKSNVLQFILEDGSRISVRPSGTEPKIKYYFSVIGKLGENEDYNIMDGILAKKISDIISSMKLN